MNARKHFIQQVREFVADHEETLRADVDNLGLQRGDKIDVDYADGTRETFDGVDAFFKYLQPAIDSVTEALDDLEADL